MAITFLFGYFNKAFTNLFKVVFDSQTLVGSD